jgi:branched-chain amino acid transport system substrate-binding protein
MSRRSFLKLAGLATGGLLFDPMFSARKPIEGPVRRLRSWGRPLKLGVLLPTSSLYPALDKNLLAGMKLYFDRLGGQIHDRVIDLIPREIGFGHGLALRASHQLIEEEKVDLVVGVISSEVAARLRHLFEAHQTPLIVANAGANVVREADTNPYVFYNSLNYWQANWAMGAWAGANLGRTALVVTSLYDSGYDALHAFRAGLASVGGAIAQTMVTHASSEVDDLEGVLATINRGRPDFVFAAYCGAPAADFVTAFARSGLAQQFPLAVSGFMVEEDLLSAQGNAALGVRSVLTWASSLDSPENTDFIAAYARRTGRPPEPLAALGFDTAQLILQATDAVGGGGRRKEHLRDALRHVEWTSPRGRLAMDPQTHSSNSPLYLREVRIQGGRPGNAVVSELDSIPELQVRTSLEHASPKTGWLNAYLSA